MDNLLESNERTLVLFDSVCSGLSECLSLVHADIKQMTEHRNKLALLEQEQIQAKLIPTPELVVVTNSHENFKNKTRNKKQQVANGNSEKNKLDSDKHGSEPIDDDPHHLAGLKLLDKRLADSFSQALSLSDLQKSSIAAKQQASQNRPSIFQVLLGKTTKSNNNQTNHSKKKGAISRDNSKVNETEKVCDNRVVIDDINRQTRLAMQYSKQLEAHLFKVEDLRTRYEMHLKMGLVVKSVARAYLGNGCSSSSPSAINPSGSLARRHCSSLVINDSSSLGTRSSLSSLNLSTWSSSRSKANRRRAAAATASPNNGCRHGNSNNQMFVSTISLNNSKTNNRRLDLAKLISPSSSVTQAKQDLHYTDLNTMNGLKYQRVPSQQSIEQQQQQQQCQNNYAHTDWIASEQLTDSCCGGNLTSSDTLSKSSVNLDASRSSWKGSARATKNQQGVSSKTTIKEFIENIDKIEAEFESYMGSFLLAIEDIQGFARVCQGDVFEITIKYGDSQKFKTKISVLKDNRQKCDNRQTVFKARISDVLAIKAYECKGLGKRVLLGNKLCETRDLFTARSQLMTISLNQTGSIKLNLIVTWNPLHLSPSSSPALPGVDISHISLPPTPISSSTLSSLSSVPSLNGTTTTINIQSKYYRNKVDSPPDMDKHQRQDSMYQTVDPTYGYYIPPPDYLTNDQKY